MRTAVVNQMMAFMLACASVCSWHGAAHEPRQETARDPRCGWLDKANRWQLDPALAERQMPPRERLSLDHQARLRPIVAAAPTVLAKMDTVYVHPGRWSAPVSSIAPLHSLFSASCLLIV